MSLYDHETLVASYLPEIGVTFTILSGPTSRCPSWCEDHDKPGLGKFPRRTHIHGDHFSIQFSRPGRDPFITDFWDSYKDSEARHQGLEASPTPYTVLACLEKYPPSPVFAEWCADYGYDDDSIKAKSIWESCLSEYHRLSRFFTPEELTHLQEIAQ